MIIPLQGNIAAQDLRKILNQLRDFQQETEIQIPWKITHGSKEGDEEDDGLLAPFPWTLWWCPQIDTILTSSESLSGWLYSVEVPGSVLCSSSPAVPRTQCRMEGSSQMLTSEQNVWRTFSSPCSAWRHWRSPPGMLSFIPHCFSWPLGTLGAECCALKNWGMN